MRPRAITRVVKDRLRKGPIARRAGQGAGGRLRDVLRGPRRRWLAVDRRRSERRPHTEAPCPLAMPSRSRSRDASPLTRLRRSGARPSTRSSATRHGQSSSTHPGSSTSTTSASRCYSISPGESERRTHGSRFRRCPKTSQRWWVASSRATSSRHLQSAGRSTSLSR